MVFLLHFDRPYRGGRHCLISAPSAAHAEAIITDPRRHSKSPLLIGAHDAGVEIDIGQAWRGDAATVFGIRNLHRPASRCDVCARLRGEAIAR